VKILLVSHRFPPEGTAGTEVYTADLARALVRRGHEVHVFTAKKDVSLEDLTLTERSFHGVAVHELVNNLFYDDFRETWDHPRITAIFGELLARLDPDVLHVQHLLYLSVGCIEVAAERDVPIVFTLHDYWLQCPRFGQRIHGDGRLCETVDFARCGTCLPSFKWRQTPREREMSARMTRVRSKTGIDLAPLARTAAEVLKKPARPYVVPPTLHATKMEAAAEVRSQELFGRVVPCVDVFLSPSRFLRERFMREWGIHGAKIEHLRFGVDLAAFAAVQRTRADRVRVGFLGSLVAVKGAHVLLDAWGRIPEDLRARGSLVLHGSAQHEPDYVARVEALAEEVGARLGGRLERAEVPRAHASLDLLVVPSVWFENSPLVIHEALAAGTPLLVSDLGGMAELVEEGRGGWRFRTGDAGDLARHLSALLADPAPLAAIGATRPSIPTFDQHAAEVEALYGVLGG